MNKNKIVKIIIPICIILVIAGIWLFKNMDRDSEKSGTPSENKEGSTLVNPNQNEDFVLETDAIDLELLKQNGLPMIIDFGADSCEPCRKMAPALVTINREMQGKAIVKFVDVWKNTDAANDFPVQVIPTQFFFNADGTPYVPSDTIDIEFTMYSYKETEEHVYTAHQGGLTEDQMRLILKDMGVSQ